MNALFYEDISHMKKNMMNKILTYSLAIAFCLLSSTSYAKKSIEQCEAKQDTTSGLSSCFDIVKASIDKELQTWINNQVFILEEFALTTGRRSALDMFKRSLQRKRLPMAIPCNFAKNWRSSGLQKVLYFIE